MTTMPVTRYEFGRIVIDDRSCASDVIVTPEQVIDCWWRKEGHDLQIADLDDIMNARPDMLVIGTGYFGRTLVPDKTKQ